jgi:signal transduction histidine kinase
LAEEGAEVTLTGNGTGWSVARKDELKEVLVNLLENARNAGATRIVVGVAAGQITVEDDGAGIAADQLPRIFEPRFSTTTSGSGLGLPIVRRLVEGWGGKVSVSSDLGRGTRVVIHIPEASPPGQR